MGTQEELDQEALSSHSCRTAPGLQQYVLPSMSFITQQLNHLSNLYDTEEHKNGQ